MEIGATNVSAMFGPHVASIATATEKFALPYVLLSPPPPPHGAPAADNLVTVTPAPDDIFTLTSDVLKFMEWTDVAIIYDSDEGTLYQCHVRQIGLSLLRPLCLKSCPAAKRMGDMANIELPSKGSYENVIFWPHNDNRRNTDTSGAKMLIDELGRYLDEEAQPPVGGVRGRVGGGGGVAGALACSRAHSPDPVMEPGFRGNTSGN